MNKNFYRLFGITAAAVLMPLQAARPDFPQYPANPFVIDMSENPLNGSLIVADADDDGLPDYLYRSATKVYVLKHDGNALWEASIAYPGPGINNHGTKLGAGDVDGDGRTEVAALDPAGWIAIYSGASGNLEKTIPLPAPAADQIYGHIAVVNLRGAGDRDAVVQTMDVTNECHTEGCSGYKYYLNRTLAAFNLQTGDLLWSLPQNTLIEDGFYEGYWGQAHGPFMAADVDGDGRDEVVGGNYIDDDGTVHDLGYPMDWISWTNQYGYVDHLDAISIGDFRPNLPGLEWVVTEEDAVGFSSYNTRLMCCNGILWTREFDKYPYEEYREPQHTAVGNFDTSRPFSEVWNRSRLDGDESPYNSQHPWIYDNQGTLIAHYQSSNVLPPGFNTSPLGNRSGIEFVWTIDWTGAQKECIAARARYVNGHFGVFNAVTGDSVWTTLNRAPLMQCREMYVADVAGDGREEMIVVDLYDGKLKVFWNDQPNPHQPKPDKWQDPLYRRLKQNWNDYSPGSYTYGDYPLISNIRFENQTASATTILWDTSEPASSQVAYGLTQDLESLTPLDPALTTTHQMRITGLKRNQTYLYQIRSANSYGKLGLSRIGELDYLSLAAVKITDIRKSGTDQIRLTWEKPEKISQFMVYRGNRADFEPDTLSGSNRVGTRVEDGDPSAAGVQWTDPSDVIGDCGVQYFYKVTSYSDPYEGAPSKAVGEYDYPLLTPPTTHFNAVAIPFALATLTPAQFLQMLPGCNSVARWNPAVQGYEQVVTGVPSSAPFQIVAGNAYYVNASADTFATFLGEPVYPVFTLLHHAGSSSFNDIMVPPDKSILDKASKLMADIPHCSSVSRWNAGTQGYDQYIPGKPSTDFSVKPGLPYLVHVTSSTTWPAEGSPKALESCPVRESRAPHAVTGTLDPGGKRRVTGFSAWMQGRPADILSDHSPGCRLSGDFWMVQCASFASAWRAGDELIINLKDGQGIFSRAAVVLTWNPVDDCDPVRLSEDAPPADILKSNHPNPFNQATVIRFSNPERSRVILRIFNSRGQHVRTLADGIMEAGEQRVEWDGKDRQNLPAPSGLYMVQVKCGNRLAMGKMALIR
ncbi:VCBS repeat-containing protein [bacterium]|nr:VCBS repeat-containing protein [bacterium]